MQRMKHRNNKNEASTLSRLSRRTSREPSDEELGRPEPFTKAPSSNNIIGNGKVHSPPSSNGWHGNGTKMKDSGLEAKWGKRGVPYNAYRGIRCQFLGLCKNIASFFAFIWNLLRCLYSGGRRRRTKLLIYIVSLVVIYLLVNEVYVIRRVLRRRRERAQSQKQIITTTKEDVVDNNSLPNGGAPNEVVPNEEVRSEEVPKEENEGVPLRQMISLKTDKKPRIVSKPSHKNIINWTEGTKTRDPARFRQVKWWTENKNAPLGLSCFHTDEDAQDTYENYEYLGFNIPPPVFKGRMPSLPASSEERVQVAFVIAFVEFQLNKVEHILTNYWTKHPPCLPGAKKVSADLVFFSEITLSDDVQNRISTLYRKLGKDRVGCFWSDSPHFISLTDTDMQLSHLEGAAFDFYMLFELLETKYNTFMLAEPDIVPIQDNFLPAVVKESKTLRCSDDGRWQVGSLPLARDVENGMLKERLDYHMNGNSFYSLGCPDFEDYKCRVQTYYTPKLDCKLVAGCATHQAFEGGYDHAMYRYRTQPDNYEYSRLVMHHFAFSNFMQNRGEAPYDPVAIVKESPSTYFVHSKSIYVTNAATILKEVVFSILKAEPCLVDNSLKGIVEKIYGYLRTGEYTKVDAARHLCRDVLPKKRADENVCNLYHDEVNGLAETNWKNKMMERTYLWTMDFHGGPANCDIPIIYDAGGALHAEIDGICDFYGLCKDRLKVIKADHWKEFDPSEKQKSDFELAYRNDPEFKRVDAFLCHHPVANCELFLPFNRSIIVHATTRIEFGRHDAGIDWRLGSGYEKKTGQKKWKKWVKTLQDLATDKRNIIAANNAYDQQYIKYFTGISDVLLLPSWCGEGIGVKFCESGWENRLQPSWISTRSEVMLVPYRSNLDRSRFEQSLRQPIDHPIMQELRDVPLVHSSGTEVKLISELYVDSNPIRMLNHPAVVIIPYQISTMNLVELYRLNIPMFCPSLSLLKRWDRKHDLLWEVHYGWPENLVPNPDNIPDPNGRLNMDRNSEEWENMFDYWVPLADFYQMKGITYFDSWQDFYRKYHEFQKNGRLDEISHEMSKENNELRNDLVDQWKSILARVRKT